MAKHKVNWKLSHKRGDFKEGQIVDLTKAEAEELLPLGVITPLESSEETGPVDALSAAQLKAMTKEELAQYAHEAFDAAIDPAESTKDEMLAKIAELVAGKKAE